MLLPFASVYTPTGNPDGTHYSPPYAPGEIGDAFEVSQKIYQVVVMDTPDPKATPPSTAGPPEANQPLYWKDKRRYIVTNDAKLAEGVSLGGKAGDQVAGILRCAALAGEVIHILQQAYNVPIASDGKGAYGEDAVISTTAKTSQVTSQTAGSATPSPSIGKIRGGAVAGVINVDLNIPSAL
jgi:hypothetical protein